MEIYIHIPFCVRKCLYCDFVSFDGKNDQIDAYVDALCKEISVVSQEYRDVDIETIYIGGGTPSILNVEQITKVVETLNGSFNIKGIHSRRTGLFLQKKLRPKTEFSIECNPCTVDKEKLKTFKKLGINRISLGLQSTDDKDLKTLGRIHNYDDFANAFEWAREAGFDNINVDLMQAIPGQNLTAWKRVLAVLGTWNPEHISAYSLIIEEGTRFQEMFDKGELPLPDEDEEREIYYYTRDFLEKSGYHRYEISNYSKAGFECLHNIGYWKRKEYLGLGLNASSFLGDTRWKNTAELDKYISSLKNDAFIPDAIREEAEKLSHKEQMEEFVMLGLRMTEGISKTLFLETFRQDFDYTYGIVAHKMKELGLLDTDGDRVYLTDRGFDVSNMVLAEFLL